MSQKNHFTIAIDCYNHEQWIEKCLNSCLTQKYDNFDVILVDAISTDKSFEIAKEYEKDFDNFKAYQNEVQLPQVANFLELTKLAKPGSIVVSIDSDDWLYNNKVLQKLDEVYGQDETQVYMTYGSYVEMSKGGTRDVSFHYRSYSDEEIRNNAFREAPWLASHLRTWRRELALKINKESLCLDSGEWLDTTGDQGLIHPMLEMAGTRSRFIPETLYCYNVGNQSRDSAGNSKRQEELATYIRTKKQKYQPLVSL